MENTLHLNTYHQGNSYPQPCTSEPAQTPIQPGQSATTGWYVIHCQPCKERYAARVLQIQYGLTIYLPEVLSYYQGQVRPAPLFPRYLFAYTNLYTTSPGQINATPGVSRMVMFSEIPQPIPEQVVQGIYHEVERLNDEGGLTVTSFHPGDTVILKGGPLQGLEAIFVGPTTPSQRVRILLEFMGQLNEVEVERGTLETTTSVVSAPTTKRERRTRGKGRRIT